MDQSYSKRESIPMNSLKNTEKFDNQNNNIVVKQNNSNKSNHWLRDLRQKWDKYVYTLCFLIGYLNLGLVNCVFPTTMVDMRFLFHTTMAKIGICASFGTVGYLTGSLCGFLYKHINRQLVFVLLMTMMGVFLMVQPFCTSLWQLYVTGFLGALGSGCFDSGNTVWIVEMWSESAPPLFQLSQMMYGIGTIIGPLMVTQYVIGDLSNKTDDTTTGTPTTTTQLITLYSTLSTTTAISSNSTSDDDINYSVDRRPKLMVPYLVGGGITLTVPIVFLVMFFVKRYKIPEKQTLNKKTITNETIGGDSTDKHVKVSPTTRKVLIALVALSLNSYSGFESTFFVYVSAYYQYLPIHLTASSAAVVMAVMTSTYTAGRGVSAFVASKLSGEVMLMYHMVIIALSLTVLYLGQNSMTFIYVGNAMIGFGFSAMWSAYFALSEKYIGLTDKVTSIFSFTSALFSVSAPFLLGPQIEKRPQIFLYIMIGLFFSIIFLFSLIMIVVRRSQRYPIAYNVN